MISSGVELGVDADAETVSEPRVKSILGPTAHRTVSSSDRIAETEGVGN